MDPTLVNVTRDQLASVRSFRDIVQMMRECEPLKRLTRLMFDIVPSWDPLNLLTLWSDPPDRDFLLSIWAVQRPDDDPFGRVANLLDPGDAFDVRRVFNDPRLGWDIDQCQVFRENHPFADESWLLLVLMHDDKSPNGSKTWIMTAWHNLVREPKQLDEVLGFLSTIHRELGVAIRRATEHATMAKMVEQMLISDARRGHILINPRTGDMIGGDRVAEYLFRTHLQPRPWRNPGIDFVLRHHAGIPTEPSAPQSATLNMTVISVWDDLIVGQLLERGAPPPLYPSPFGPTGTQNITEWLGNCSPYDIAVSVRDTYGSYVFRKNQVQYGCFHYHTSHPFLAHRSRLGTFGGKRTEWRLRDLKSPTRQRPIARFYQLLIEGWQVVVIGRSKQAQHDPLRPEPKPKASQTLRPLVVFEKLVM